MISQYPENSFSLSSIQKDHIKKVDNMDFFVKTDNNDFLNLDVYVFYLKSQDGYLVGFKAPETDIVILAGKFHDALRFSSKFFGQLKSKISQTRYDYLGILDEYLLSEKLPFQSLSKEKKFFENILEKTIKEKLSITVNGTPNTSVTVMLNYEDEVISEGFIDVD